MLFGTISGTIVMQVIATDDDKEGTNNSKMFYSIAEESNTGGMFAINHETGVVTVQKRTLDREVRRFILCAYIYLLHVSNFLNCD